MNFDWLWKAMVRFGYRRLVRRSCPEPMGIPGRRDPLSPCKGYEPRKWRFGDWRHCDSDGHYLCQECCHLKKEKAP